LKAAHMQHHSAYSLHKQTGSAASTQLSNSRIAKLDSAAAAGPDSHLTAGGFNEEFVAVGRGSIPGATVGEARTGGSGGALKAAAGPVTAPEVVAAEDGAHAAGGKDLLGTAAAAAEGIPLDSSAGSIADGRALPRLGAGKGRVLYEAASNRVLGYSVSIGGQVKSHILSSVPHIVPLPRQPEHHQDVKFTGQRDLHRRQTQQQQKRHGGWVLQGKVEGTSADHQQGGSRSYVARHLQQQGTEQQQQQLENEMRSPQQQGPRHNGTGHESILEPSQSLSVIAQMQQGKPPPQQQPQSVPVAYAINKTKQQNNQQQGVLGPHPLKEAKRVQPLLHLQKLREHAPVSLDGAGKIQLLAFCCFEVLIGVFWPTMMTLRAEHVPEHERSTIMNVFRVPLNVFVCIILWKVSRGRGCIIATGECCYR
jgi:hypothetical protein